MTRVLPLRAFAALGLLCGGAAHAAQIDLFPGQSFEAAVAALHAGTYADAGRISVTVRGTQAAPVLVKGADGEAVPLITRTASSAVQNTINIEGATWLRITGLEISGNGGDGINLSGANADITLDDLEIHEVDVGINFRTTMTRITVRHNHIHHTGQNGGTGEGMYIGCNDAACIVSNSLIENNWIHDTRNSTQGDGIEVKLGSHSNIVRDNVIHDTGYPCVLVYGTAGQPVNVVEGNVLWNCGDSGIQAAADAIIRNNIILESPGNGFNSQPHQAAVPSNLQFVHNTVVGGSPCVRLGSWNARTGLVFANNAIYCDADDFAIGGLANVVVAGNVVVPATSALPASGYRVGQSVALDFADAAARNLYPRAGSHLIDAGDATYATSVDFNGTARTGAPDAGAYDHSTTQNPGWAVVAGFKGAATQPVPPTVTFSGNPLSVTTGGSTDLAWNAAGATACAASASPARGDWSGSRATSGRATIAGLAETTRFTLSCDNTAGTASQSVTVTVGAAPAPAPPVDLTARPPTVAAGARSPLPWGSTNATGCTASGAWAGNKASAGSEQTPNLAATSTFTLACTGAGGSAERSVTVTVSGGEAPAPEPGEGGGGALGGWWLAFLGVLLVREMRRRVPGQGTPGGWIDAPPLRRP